LIAEGFCRWTASSAAAFSYQAAILPASGFFQLQADERAKHQRSRCHAARKTVTARHVKQVPGAFWPGGVEGHF